jgi:hypothetical protein
VAYSAYAYSWARQLGELRPGSRLIVGASLKADQAVAAMPFATEAATAADTASALSLLRQVVTRGGLCHHGSPDLAQQQDDLRVAVGPTLVVRSTAPSYLIRAGSWAVAAVERSRRGAPAVW